MPNEKEKIVALALRLEQKGKLAEAVKEYQKSLELDSKDSRIHTKLAELFIRLKIFEKAIHHYLETAKLFTRDGFYSKALSRYRRVLDLDEGRYDVCLLMADCYQRLGMISDALENFRRVAYNYEKVNQLKEALGVYGKMADLEPRNPAVLNKILDLCKKVEAQNLGDVSDIKENALKLLARLEAQVLQEGLAQEQGAVATEAILLKPEERIAQLEKKISELENSLSKLRNDFQKELLEVRNEIKKLTGRFAKRLKREK
ncbi:MAG: tetratricopeptide repeat protein [Patescibacteria group bacterium]|nr:tetratricopeptide repeat protein [Patescibacteria group bacterium]